LLVLIQKSYMETNDIHSSLIIVKNSSSTSDR